MQFKSITLLVLLLGLVALVQSVAVASPGYDKPHNYDEDNCKNQCKQALQPVSDSCERAYGDHHHHRRGGSGWNMGQNVDVEGIFSSICLTTISEGCHKCFFLVAITCIFNYQQNYWDKDFFETCIITTVAGCWS